MRPRLTTGTPYFKLSTEPKTSESIRPCSKRTSANFLLVRAAISWAVFSSASVMKAPLTRVAPRSPPLSIVFLSATFLLSQSFSFVLPDSWNCLAKYTLYHGISIVLNSIKISPLQESDLPHFKQYLVSLTDRLPATIARIIMRQDLFQLIRPLCSQ